MHFCAIHLDEASWPPDEEEVYVVVPGGSKTAMVVPLDALAQFLPLLEQAVGGPSPPTCPACAAKIPKLDVCPAAHCDPADPG
jgi:hypothetical protein